MRIDAIFDNARIRTLDPARPTATRIGVLHGRIVGFDEELDGVTAEHHTDLRGAPVLPGFHDAHFHLSLTGARLAALDLRPGVVGSLTELYDAVAAHAATLPQDAWVRGSGYDQNLLGAHPSAEALDAAAGGRPVILEHVSGHMVTVSTRAFELGGYPGRAGVPEFDGGAVPREADGRATGLLQERAMSFIYALVRPMDLAEVQRNLGLAGAQAARYGLTSVTEPGIGDHTMIGNTPADFHSYQQAVEQGTLRTRVTLMPYCTTLHEVEGFKDRSWFGLDLGIRTGLGDDRLRVGPVKIVSDGSFIGRSAAMHRCYHGEQHNRGVMQFDPQELQRMVVGAHEAGWSVAAHAIGDAAIDHVMDAVEIAQRRTPRPGVRHRIEHFALATDAQISRAAGLGLTAVPQGVFISDFGDGMMDAVDPELAPADLPHALPAGRGHGAARVHRFPRLRRQPAGVHPRHGQPPHRLRARPRPRGAAHRGAGGARLHVRLRLRRRAGNRQGHAAPRPVGRLRGPQRRPLRDRPGADPRGAGGRHGGRRRDGLFGDAVRGDAVLRGGLGRRADTPLWWRGPSS